MKEIEDIKKERIIESASKIREKFSKIPDEELLHTFIITAPLNVVLHLAHERSNEILLDAGIVEKQIKVKTGKISYSKNVSKMTSDRLFEIMTDGVKSGMKNSDELAELLSSTISVYETMFILSTHFAEMTDIFIKNLKESLNEIIDENMPNEISNAIDELDGMSDKEFVMGAVFNKVMSELTEKQIKTKKAEESKQKRENTKENRKGSKTNGKKKGTSQ